MDNVLLYTYKKSTPVEVMLKLNKIEVEVVLNDKKLKSALISHNYRMCIINVHNKDEIMDLVNEARSTSEQMFIMIINDEPICDAANDTAGLRVKNDLDNLITQFIDYGADDYYGYPYNINYIIAIINARIKRAYDFSMKQIINIGEYVLNVQDRILSYADGTDIRLSFKEACIIQLLAHFANTTVQRQLILKSIWHEDSYYNSRSLDVYMVKIKKYLSFDPNISIKTERGYGYCLMIS